MQVIPAIDLRGGFCVRLRQGDFGHETVFGDDPAAMAARWEVGRGGADPPGRSRRGQGRPSRERRAGRGDRQAGHGAVPARRGRARSADDRDLAGRGAGAGGRGHAGPARPGLVLRDGRGVSRPARSWGWTRARGRSRRRAGWRRFERRGSCRWPGSLTRCRWRASSTPTSRVTACWRGRTSRPSAPWPVGSRRP